MAVRPDEEKLTQLKEMLKKDYHATEVILREEQRDDLLGGYILQVGDRIIDNTVKRAFDNLEKNLEKEQGVNDIISVLKSDISGFEGEFNEEEGGRILSLHDGIVSVSGSPGPCTAKSYSLKTEPRVWSRILMKRRFFACRWATNRIWRWAAR